MSIKTFVTHDGNCNGTPDKYTPRAAEGFFSDDRTLEELSHTCNSIAEGYNMNLGELKTIDDYHDSVNWFKELMETEAKDDNDNFLEILQLALERAKQIIA